MAVGDEGRTPFGIEFPRRDFDGTTPGFAAERLGRSSPFSSSCAEQSTPLR